MARGAFVAKTSSAATAEPGVVIKQVAISAGTRNRARILVNRIMPIRFGPPARSGVLRLAQSICPDDLRVNAPHVKPVLIRDDRGIGHTICCNLILRPVSGIRRERAHPNTIDLTTILDLHRRHLDGTQGPELTAKAFSVRAVAE